MSRNRPRDVGDSFEWPPSSNDLSAVSVLPVQPATPVPIPESDNRGRPTLRLSTTGGARRRMSTLQQLTLLGAGMLVGAALPGLDDERRPVMGVAQAAAAVSVLPSASSMSTAAVGLLRSAPVPTMATPTAAATALTAAPVTAPAHVPAAAMPAVAPARIDPRTRQVLQTLNKYQAAFSRMDASATSAVWPSADRAQLTRTFTAVREQRLWLRGCTISGTGPQAAGTCQGTLRYRPRVGDHSTRLKHGTWRFALEQSEGRWLIRRVTVS